MGSGIQLMVVVVDAAGRKVVTVCCGIGGSALGEVLVLLGRL